MPAAPNFANVAPPQFNRFTLTSASPTALTNIQNSPGIIYGIVNTGPALTVYLRLYDEGTTAGTQADCVWGDGTTATAIGAGAIISFGLNGMRLYYGLTYSLTGPLPATGNLQLLVQ